MSNELAPIQPVDPRMLTREQVDLLKRTFGKGLTDDEFQLAVQTAQRRGLDLFSRQACAIGRWDEREGRMVMAVQVTIDGFRVIAERTGKYKGQRGPFWCGEDGVWHDAWLKATPPVAARVDVLRSDFAEPLSGVARYAAFCGRKKDGTPNKMWTSFPDLMTAKCAEALALRRAFPQDLSGLYTPEEMDQAGGHEAPSPAPKQSFAQAAASAAKALPPAVGTPLPTPSPAAVPQAVAAQIVGPAPAPSAPPGEADQSIEWDSGEVPGVPATDAATPKRPPPDPNRTSASTLDAAGLGVSGPALPSQAPKQAAVGANTPQVAPGAYLTALNALRPVAEAYCQDANVPPAVLEKKWAEFIGQGESGVPRAEAWLASLQAGKKAGGATAAPAAQQAPVAPAEAGVDPAEVKTLHGWVRSVSPKKKKDGSVSDHWLGGLIKPKSADQGVPEGAVHPTYGSCNFEVRLNKDEEPPQGLEKGCEVLLSGPGWVEWAPGKHEFKATSIEIVAAAKPKAGGAA